MEALPLLARGASLRILLTRTIDWLHVPPGALVRPKDPLEYLKKLRFHRRIDRRGRVVAKGGGLHRAFTGVVVAGRGRSPRAF